MNRHSVIAILASVSLIVACTGHAFTPDDLTPPTAPGVAAWAMAGANPARTGFTNLEGPLPIAADKDLKADWTYYAAPRDSGTAPYCSAPVIDGAGNIYFVTDIQVISLTATGVQRWAVHIDQLNPGGFLPTYSDPLLTAHNLLIVTDDVGGVWALDGDGKTAWHLDDLGYYGSQLVLAGDRLYVAQGRTLYAVSETGGVLWNLDLPDRIEYHTALAVAPDGTLLLRDKDGSFVAVSSEGTVRWIYPAQLDDSTSWPYSVYANGQWLIPSSLGLAALNEDGVKVWEYLITSVNHLYMTTAAPAVDIDGTIYIPLDRREDHELTLPEKPPALIALDHNVNLRWEYGKEYYPSSLRPETVIIDGAGKLYLSGWAGTRILNRQGEELGEIATYYQGRSVPRHLAVGLNRQLILGYHLEALSGYSP
jgi:hypothetical protein